MGLNLNQILRQELANLDKDTESRKSAMKALQSFVKELDSKAIPGFLAQVFETKETNSLSGEYTISLYEILARVHGPNFVPQIDTIMSTIVKTLASSAGSFPLQQACSKVIPAIARYGIDPTTTADKKRLIIHSLCKPLTDSLLGSQESLTSGSALCLKALVDCNNWRFASDEMVNRVFQNVVVALESNSNQTHIQMGLVMSLAKHNPLIVEAYARLLIHTGLRILSFGVSEGNSQKRLSAVQMLNFLMKCLDPRSIYSEVELIIKEMERCQSDQMAYVRGAAYEAMMTSKRIAGELKSKMEKGCRSVTGSHFSRRNCPSIVNGHFPDDSLSPESQTLRNTKKRQSRDICSKHHRHGFTQDPFTELLDNRQQLQQYSESSSSSSSIYDTSGTTTPTNTTEDTFEKPKSDLGSEAKLKTGEIEIYPRLGRSKRVLILGLSVFSIAVAGFASFMWMQFQDDMMALHLVPT